MYTLRRITTAFPRAVGLRTLATRATIIDTLRARRKSSPHQPNQPASSTNQGVYGADWSSHWDTSEQILKDVSRAPYTTQIYHGQNAPDTLPEHLDTGPATGAGTGVYIYAQMFGTEVKGNPTESEADVAADRSDLDPLPQELHHTIRLGPGEGLGGPQPSESEADVAADRGEAGVDPLWNMKKHWRA